MESIEERTSPSREGLAPNRGERRFLSRKDAAEHVEKVWGRPCSPSYLAKLAVHGGGPRFRKANNRWALYTEADLDAWAASQISEPIASTSAASNAEAAQ